jgi:hypothetical protein
MAYLTKLKGSPASIPPRSSFKEISFISFGAFLAACVIGFLAYYTNQPIIMGSFGASIFVLFVLPDSPFAQPRNVIIGHFLTNAYWFNFLSSSEFRLVEYGFGFSIFYCSNAVLKSISSSGRFQPFYRFFARS